MSNLMPINLKVLMREEQTKKKKTNKNDSKETRKT